ncbi:MAG: C39 family peptidase [Oscillospiraceae bacterium]|nr:C39 family peptidase [Oscillospiraceae bacterium]
MSSKVKIIISVAVAVIAVVALILLIPIENKHKLYEKYGILAENAETDEKSAYILNNIDLYPEKILKLYYSDYEKNVDFVYNYPFHKDDYSKMSFTSEELNSDTVPLLFMADHRWGYEPVYEGYIKTHGCVPVSLTMAYLYLTGKGDIDPPKIAAIADSMDAWGTVGINNDKIVELCDAIGITAIEYDYSPKSEESGKADIDVIKNALKNGHQIMAGMVGDVFGSHAIIIREISETGDIYINDPGSAERSEKAWTFEELKSEIYFLWELSADE